MKLQKFFDPLLVAETLVLHSVSVKRRKNDDEARRYALDLARGLTVWSTIDSIAATTIALISFFVRVPVVAVDIFLLLGIGCPLAMIAGMMLGRPQQLTLERTWKIVRNYFLE